jgi:hypothetical protein
VRAESKVVDMSTACDTETCETCQVQVIEGVDQNGQCSTCSGPTALHHLLRSMAAGVSRDRRSGRFVSVKR